MTDAKQLTVVLIDDGTLLRELLVRRWARHPRIREVRYAGLAAEGRAVCEQIRPDVAIIDISSRRYAARNWRVPSRS
jgi:chemotaxis response regulator CheB